MLLPWPQPHAGGAKSRGREEEVCGRNSHFIARSFRSLVLTDGNDNMRDFFFARR